MRTGQRRATVLSLAFVLGNEDGASLSLEFDKDTNKMMIPMFSSPQRLLKFAFEAEVDMPWACLVVRDIAAFQEAVQREGLGLALDPWWNEAAGRWAYGIVSHVVSSCALKQQAPSELN